MAKAAPQRDAGGLANVFGSFDGSVPPADLGSFDHGSLERTRRADASHGAEMVLISFETAVAAAIFVRTTVQRSTGLFNVFGSFDGTVRPHGERR